MPPPRESLKSGAQFRFNAVCGTLANVARQTLLDDAYFKVAYDDVHRVLFVTRRAHTYANTDEIHQANQALLDLLNSYDRPKTGMMFDLRMAGMREDPEFTRAHSRYRVPHVAGFRMVVFLVGSEAGRIQVERIIRENGISALTALSETEALGYLIKNKAPPKN